MDYEKEYNRVCNEYIPRVQELEEENNNLKNELMEDMKYETELEEKIRFLEQCLDNKEKVNKNLRKELEELKSTYVYDAKQVRDII